MRVLLVILLLSGTAAAATFEDAEGDVALETAAGTVPAPHGNGHLDLVKAWISNETADAIQFGFEAMAEGNDVTRWMISFRVDRQSYELHSAGCDVEEARLYESTPTGLHALECTSVEQRGGTRSMTMPKAWLRGQDRQLVGEGSMIDEFQVQVRQDPSSDGARFVDRAPDAPAEKAFVLEVHGQRVGPVQWDVENAVMQSNGVSGLFTTTMRITTEQDVEILIIDDPPGDWMSLYPSKIQLRGNESVVVPLALMPPSAHRHGEAVTWPLVMEVNDERGEHQVGVAFFSIAQPAGHHPRMWIHGDAETVTPLAEQRRLWINADSEDPRQSAIRKAHDYQGIASGHWRLLMDPPLNQPLRLADDAGRAEIRLEATRPISGGTVEVGLVYCDPSIASDEGPASYRCPVGGARLLASGTGSFPTQLGDVFTVEVPLEIEPGTLPYQMDSQLALGLDVLLDPPGYVPPAPAPVRVVTPGSFLDLPLEDVPQASNTTIAHGLEVEWTPSACTEPGDGHSLTIENPSHGGTLRWSAITAPGTTLSLPADTPLPAGKRQHVEVPVGAEGMNSYGAILASHDERSFVAATWIHHGSCPIPAGGITDPPGEARAPAPWFPLGLLVLALVASRVRRSAAP